MTVEPPTLALLALGGALSLWNAYLSWVRVPLALARGAPRAEIRNVSGAPIVGSLLLALALARGLEPAALRIAAWALLALDTGGPHWFAWALVRGARGRGGAR